MKQKLALVLCLCVVLIASFTGCASSSANSDADAGSTAKTTEKVQLANPIEHYDALADAEKAAGFSFTVPEGVNVDGADYAQYDWSTINRELIEVRYGAEGNEVCYLRKAAGTGADEDISGDYNVYDDVKTVDITLEDGRTSTVTLKGQTKEGEKTPSYYVAIWQLKGAKDNGLWDYAIGIQGVPEQDLLELVKMVE